MAQIIFDNLLYGHHGVKPEQEHIVEVCSTDSIQDGELLSADDCRKPIVASYTEKLSKSFGVLAV